MTETVDVDGVPLRVVCTPGKLALAEFALEVGAFALRFFTDYFNIPYPGDKVDLVAIPDFAAGAMENLGCITFRDTALLIDQDEAARAELERVADVIAHELAHMWFGDLVTMGWWEGIWLNEAFATFMEMLCVDAFRPSWDRWIGFAPSREAALAVDALHLTRPIEYPVGPPKEAEGMFDVLTYEKGCGVLRMLEQHIGADVFRDGVRTYLKAHAYGNTVTSDLWDALEDASGAPVRDVMDTFILQGGHPLVSLHGDTLSQQPFALGTGTRRRDVVHRLGVARPRRGAGAALRRRARRAGAPPRPRCRARARSPRPEQGLAVVNAGGWGMFRVGYETAHRTALAEHLPELTPLETANLIADTWATTLAGHSTLEEFLVLASRLGDEPEPAAWSPVGSALVLTKRITLADAGGRARTRRSPRSSDPPIAGWASTPCRARATGRRCCAHWPSTCSAQWAPTPRSGRRRRGASMPRPSAAAPVSRSHPTSSRPRSGRRVTALAARRLRRAAGALPDRVHARRRRCAPSARSPDSPTSTCASAPSIWP